MKPPHDGQRGASPTVNPCSGITSVRPDSFAPLGLRSSTKNCTAIGDPPQKPLGKRARRSGWLKGEKGTFSFIGKPNVPFSETPFLRSFLRLVYRKTRIVSPFSPFFPPARKKVECPPFSPSLFPPPRFFP